jgi:hypothetical protein
MKILFLKIALSKLKNELHVQFHDFYSNDGDYGCNNKHNLQNKEKRK